MYIYARIYIYTDIDILTKQINKSKGRREIKYQTIVTKLKKAERLGINIKSNGEIQIGKRRNEDNSNKKVNNRKKRKKINNFIYSVLVSVSG